MFNDLKWYNVAIVVSNTSKFDLYIDGIKVVSKLGDPGQFLIEIYFGIVITSLMPAML